VLLLELASCLLPGQAVALEVILRLLEGGSLLLVLALLLLTRAPHLAKLLLVDGLYNKFPTVKIPETRRVYDKFHACF
jgi:hypothetical protein